MDNHQSSNFWSTQNMTNIDVDDSLSFPTQTTIPLNESTHNMGINDFQNPFPLPIHSTTPLGFSGAENPFGISLQDSTDLPPLPESFNSMDLLMDLHLSTLSSELPPLPEGFNSMDQQMDPYLPTLPSFMETDDIYQSSYNLDSLFNEDINLQPPLQPQLPSEDDRGKGKMIMQPPQPQPLGEEDKGKGKMIIEGEESNKKKRRNLTIGASSSRRNRSNMLSREIISHHFYLPINQAAKEMKVGVSLLKKRCRELSISRWPSRRLMSIQNLINTVQELGEESAESESIVKGALEVLEREKKILEEFPDMEMQVNTKKLRQACFKIKYRKKEFQGDLVNFNDLVQLYREFYQCLSDLYS